MKLPPITNTNTINSFDRHQLEVVANNYRLTPATLYSRLDSSWIPKNYLLEASLKIARAIAMGNQLITVSAPPRHGKSRLTTIATPIWVLEVLRWYHVILCTYGGELSTDFGREVRDICDKNKDLLNLELRRDVSRSAHWLTKDGGGMTSVGVGGPITGRGANVLLIDDYIKEIEEAENATQREKQWRWLTTVALTRLEPRATCIITATRWHEDDIIGRIKRGLAGEGWIHIEYPAIAEENDSLGRAVGEPLFPERYSVEALQTRRRFLGDRLFDALYQQQPHGSSAVNTDRSWISIEEKGLTNWYGYHFARIWDFSGTKNGGDYTVGMLLAVHPETGDTWILDVIRGQWGGKTIERKVMDCAISDGVGTTVIIEQEPGSAGKVLVEHYADILPDYEVVATPTTTSKAIRARPAITRAEKGGVHILNRSWTEDFLAEFDGFMRNAPHDDQVDCLAMGYNHLFKMPDGGVVFGRQIATAQSNVAHNPEHTARLGRHAAAPTQHLAITIGRQETLDHPLSDEELIRAAALYSGNGATSGDGGVAWGRSIRGSHNTPRRPRAGTFRA